MDKTDLIHLNQGSNEWHRARLGKFTASSIADLMGKGRGKDEVFSKTALSYISEVAFERMLDIDMVNNDYDFADYLETTNTTSKAMQWGKDNEPMARMLYENKFGAEVETVGMFAHPTIANFAVSPDGLVGDDGLIEIKCVGNANWVKYLDIADNASLNEIEPKYFWQVMAQLSCTGRKWCDFTVYNPFVRDPLHVARIKRDDAVISALEERVIIANELINKKWNL